MEQRVCWKIRIIPRRFHRSQQKTNAKSISTILQTGHRGKRVQAGVHRDRRAGHFPRTRGRDLLWLLPWRVCLELSNCCLSSGRSMERRWYGYHPKNAYSILNLILGFFSHPHRKKSRGQKFLSVKVTRYI